MWIWLMADAVAAKLERRANIFHKGICESPLGVGLPAFKFRSELVPSLGRDNVLGPLGRLGGAETPGGVRRPSPHTATRPRVGPDSEGQRHRRPPPPPAPVAA